MAWQLADQLREGIVAFTATGAAARDGRFCDEIRTAGSSGPANIAEGFCHYRHREFARFLAIARASLGETPCHLLDARSRRYLDAAEFDRLWHLSERAMAATTRLLAYLRTSREP